MTLPGGIVPPTLAKAFGAASISVGGTTAPTFTVTNPNAAGITGVGFSDTLPAGLTVATPNALTGSCGAGSITAVAGSGVVSLTGATLAASAACTFSANVTATSTGTKNNTTSPVTSTEGGSGPAATASVAVAAVGPAATIPTLQQWALCLLSVLLFLIGMVVHRRQGHRTPDSNSHG